MPELTSPQKIAIASKILASTTARATDYLEKLIVTNRGVQNLRKYNTNNETELVITALESKGLVQTKTDHEGNVKIVVTPHGISQYLDTTTRNETDLMRTIQRQNIPSAVD